MSARARPERSGQSALEVWHPVLVRKVEYRLLIERKHRPPARIRRHKTAVGTAAACENAPDRHAIDSRLLRHARDCEQAVAFQQVGQHIFSHITRVMADAHAAGGGPLRQARAVQIVAHAAALALVRVAVRDAALQARYTVQAEQYPLSVKKGELV